MAKAKTQLARLVRQIREERERLAESGYSDSLYLSELLAAHEALRHQDRRTGRVRTGR